MAIACFADRAPCFPSRTCLISSWTNSPACVLGDLPFRLSLRAFSTVLFSGIAAPFHFFRARGALLLGAEEIGPGAATGLLFARASLVAPLRPATGIRHLAARTRKT